ncbi:hypothetical protein Brsp02_03562 [Brucella sp. NBRC 113783]
MTGGAILSQEWTVSAYPPGTHSHIFYLTSEFHGSIENNRKTHCGFRPYNLGFCALVDDAITPFLFGELT